MASLRLDMGPAEQVQFRESTLGNSGILPLEWYFNSGRPVAGADGAVDNNYYRVHRPTPTHDPDYVPLGAWRSSASRTARPTA